MRLSRLRSACGFTLIEMLLVVTIIAILASITLPKYADLMRKSQEGGVKGNLGSLRSAISIYYGDNGGVNPSCVMGPGSTVLTDALIPKYIDKIPPVASGLHPATNAVYCDASMVPGSIHDGQGWYYDGTVPTDSLFGGVWVACDHSDTKGSDWTRY